MWFSITEIIADFQCGRGAMELVRRLGEVWPPGDVMQPTNTLIGPNALLQSE